MLWFHKFTSVLGQMGINSQDRIWNIHLFSKFLISGPVVSKFCAVTSAGFFGPETKLN